MNPRKDLTPALAALHETLGSSQGPKYWRTLEELADSEAFQELMRQEFPQQEPAQPDGLSRRQFLSLMGASLALAGLSGCSVRPMAPGTIVPYVRQPEDVVPGRPRFFATAMTLGGVGVGLLAESHLGRPTKIEGNPDHPGSLGATDVFHQASVLSLYDPDRSQTVTLRGETSTWDAALGTVPVNRVQPLGAAFATLRGRQGRGLRLLTETVVSPTMHAQIKNLLKAFPEAHWHQYEPITSDAARKAAQQAFGEPVALRYDFTKADVVLALDADFLACGPGNLRYAADFIARRRIRNADEAADKGMNRLYVVEPSVTCTGARADHRLALRARDIKDFVRALAQRLGVIADKAAVEGTQDRWLTALTADLEHHRGRCVILAGPRQPPEVHLLVHALNQHLENIGQTVLHTTSIEAESVDHLESLQNLTEAMDAGSVELLLILGGNPVFTAPADFRFVERLQNVPLRAHLSLYQDETSRQCQWHLPEAHYLESWGDTRAYDGTASLVQPLIQPLYQGRSALEVFAVLTNGVPTPGYELVRAFWKDQWRTRGESGSFEVFWQTSLHDGVVAGTRFPHKARSLPENWQDHLPKPAGGAEISANPDYEIVYQQDPTIYDGRFANNGWLQELPKPMTTLTWDNAALMSPAMARELGVDHRSYAHGGEHGGYHVPVIELTVDGRIVEAPVWVTPGHADGSLTLSLGYGRTSAGRIGGESDNPLGVNTYALRSSGQPWFARGVRIRKTGKTYLLACTQAHHLMENRAVVRAATLKEFQTDPHFVEKPEKELAREEAIRGRKPLTMYEPKPPAQHKWAMTIDLTACTGCEACVVACQSENNIPVVGKDQVSRGREMHWLRVDRYIAGTEDDPREFHFQPVPCMHCEDAPCEYVCPVEATVHSADGLNDMVYQRCVGTRFCSNNCPYKVRRFNFLAYSDYATESRRMQYNPDVTVRSRGVMEKCSYCVQRIRQADIEAQKEKRPIRDGEILTACQAACPTKAIVFGDMNDAQSEVSRSKESPLNYALLGDLNTRPRTTYLAALSNPNPELEA